MPLDVYKTRKFSNKFKFDLVNVIDRYQIHGVKVLSLFSNAVDLKFGGTKIEPEIDKIVENIVMNGKLKSQSS